MNIKIQAERHAFPISEGAVVMRAIVGMLADKLFALQYHLRDSSSRAEPAVTLSTPTQN